MSGRRYHIDGSPIRMGARPAKAPLMPDGLRKLKLDLAYEEAKEEARKRKARREKLPPPPPSPPKPAGDCNFDLLNIALEAAVPLWIHRFKDVPLERVLNRKRLEELGDIVAERGDVVLYCTKKKTADAFNKLAEALARLAHTQGGVLFNGVRYEAPARSA